jgi:Tol biopolymer transport system component
VAGMDRARTRLEPPRRLTLELGDDYPTAWTRDSKSVILTSDRNGPMNIFRQSLDRQTAEPLVTLPGTQYLPRMAPDRASLWFCNVQPEQGPQPCRLMRLPLDGGAPELIAAIPKLWDFRCSAAGPCLITQNRLPDPGRIVSELSQAKGKGREIYRDEQNRGVTPDISPDGKWIAAVTGNKIVVRSYQSGAIVREIPVPEVTTLLSLDYAPDGKGFFTGDATSTAARELYVDLSGKATVLWRQAGAAVIWGIPSPDGKYLALQLSTVESNVYMLEQF